MDSCRISVSALAWIFAAGFSLVASGQTDVPSIELDRAARVDCRFSTVGLGIWKDGRPSPTVEVAELSAAYSHIDVAQGTATAEGRAGSSYIVVRHTEGSLHFIQISDVGPLYVTTVFAQKTPAGRLIAVHTRHEFAASRYPEFREWPKTYFGDCSFELS